MYGATVFDLAGLAVLVVGWFGYTAFADRAERKSPNLVSAMQRHRLAWMQAMMKRELRMVDSQITGISVSNVSLLASTTVLILGALAAALMAPEGARMFVSNLPFVVQTSRELWDLKVLGLAVVFVYGFFKFAWALRQFNYAAVLIGAAPEPAETGRHDVAARQLADLGSLAVLSYNRGIRAYYFGLAMLSWFLNPILLIAAVAWVVAVLYRREFRSRTLRVLSRAVDGVPVPDTEPKPEPLQRPRGHRTASEN